MGITVERGGELSVTAPDETPLGQVEALVRRKLFWVFAKLAEKALSVPAAAREGVRLRGGVSLPGPELPTAPDGRGRGQRVGPIAPTGGRFVLPRREQARADELFTRWYCEHAIVWLHRRVDRLAPRIGKSPTDIRVRDLGNRWGSCAEGGLLNFHWRVIRLPPTLIEYVSSRRTVHLLEPRHDAAFWSRLERVLSDYRQRKRLLAEQGCAVLTVSGGDGPGQVSSIGK